MAATVSPVVPPNSTYTISSTTTEQKSSIIHPHLARQQQQQQPAAMTWADLSDRFDLVTVCGFAIVVLGVAFGSILTEEDVPFWWLLAGVSLASVGAFIRLQL